MAILTYSGPAGLEGFYAWAQRNAQPPAVPCPTGNVLEILPRLLTRGTYAEAGDTVRFSAFLASGDAVIDFGGQWADNNGTYNRYSRTLEMSAADSPARVTMPASAGWYRDAAASLRTGGITGQTLYITQELGRNNGTDFQPIAMLAQGWLTSAAPVSDVTNHPPETSGGGGGNACVCPSTYAIQSIDGIMSAQGWQVNRTPAANTVERIVQMNFTMTAGASTGPRYMFVENVVYGVGPVFYQRTDDDIPANLDTTFQVNIDEGAAYNEPDVRYGKIPGSLWYAQQYQMQVGIGNFTSGDEVINAYAIIEIRA